MEHAVHHAVETEIEGSNRVRFDDASLKSQRAKSKRRRGRHMFDKDYAAELPFLPNFMQWAHSFLSLKYLYYVIVLDGLTKGTISFFVCWALSRLVLDRFTNPDGIGLGTWSCSYFILRTSQEAGGFVEYLALNLQLPTNLWVAQALSVPVVTFAAINFAAMSLFWFYGSIICWELCLLPIAAMLRLLLPQSVNPVWPRRSSASIHSSLQPLTSSFPQAITPSYLQDQPVSSSDRQPLSLSAFNPRSLSVPQPRSSSLLRRPETL